MILGMENTTSENKPEALPPPPPPLPPFPKTTSSRLVSPPVKSSVRRTKKKFPFSIYIGHASDKIPKSIATFYKDVEPILQDGPCCGIVALSMASQFFKGKHHTAQDILTAAKSLQFSRSGEMFSAHNMAALAQSLIGCKATVVSGLLEHKRDILSCICEGFPVLIPYDADKNHQPCLNKGRNAHWALLNGVCLELSEDLSDLGYKRWGDVDCAFQLSSGSHAERYLDSSIQMSVFAYQGKSLHMALWDFEALLSSNRNMFEVTTKYSFDMLLPSGGDALSELRDKAVFLKENII